MEESRYFIRHCQKHPVEEAAFEKHWDYYRRNFDWFQMPARAFQKHIWQVCPKCLKEAESEFIERARNHAGIERAFLKLKELEQQEADESQQKLRQQEGFKTHEKT